MADAKMVGADILAAESGIEMQSWWKRRQQMMQKARQNFLLPSRLQRSTYRQTSFKKR